MQLYSIFHLIFDKICLILLVLLPIIIIHLVIKEHIKLYKEDKYKRTYRTEKEIKAAIKKEQEKCNQ